MKIIAVTPAYNEDHYLAEFRRHADVCSAGISEHIIVDDGSGRGYVAELHRMFPECTVRERVDRGGLAAAINDGIRVALEHDADAVLLLVQDISILGESVAAMARVLQERPRAGIVGPVLVDRDGTTIQEFGGVVDPRTLDVTKLFAGERDNARLPRLQQVQFVAGGVNLVRGDVFRQIGLLDERLFMYGDELDFGMRARARGWELVVTRAARASHEHYGDDSVLRPRPVFLMTRNQLWLVRKHLGQGAAAQLVAGRLWGLPRRIGHYLRRGRLDLARAYVGGLIHGVVGV